MKKYCLHTHTKRCGHAIGEDEEYIQQAIKEGFDVYGYSDHVMFLNVSQRRIRGDFSMLKDYLDSINKIKEKYKNQIEIHIGFEAEYFKEFTDFYRFLHLTKKIEYLILGQHFYFQEDMIKNFGLLGSSGALVKYANCLIEGIKTGLFSIVAHPDLFIYWYEQKDELFYEYINKIIDTVIEMDVALELNISKITNLKKAGSSSPKEEACFPVDEFWELVAKKGAKVVVGLDCHCVEAVSAEDFEYGINLARQYGLNLVDIDLVINKFTNI